MVRVRSRYRKRLGNQSCWQWQCRCIRNPPKENESKEGSGNMDCGDGHESFQEPSVKRVGEEPDEVEKMTTMMMRTDENEDSPKDNVVEDGRGG